MKKVLLGVVIALVLLFGGCLALVGGGIAAIDEEAKKDAQTAREGGVTSNTDDEAIEHVKIRSCTVSDFGIVTADVVIDNAGKDQASYIVTGEALRKGRRVSELTAIANDVRPGQKVNAEATGSIKGGAKVTCKLVSVDRF